jgi:hypothetical protein
MLQLVGICLCGGVVFGDIDDTGNARRLQEAQRQEMQAIIRVTRSYGSQFGRAESPADFGATSREIRLAFERLFLELKRAQLRLKFRLSERDQLMLRVVEVQVELSDRGLKFERVKGAFYHRVLEPRYRR